jgi:hypothetical protein
VVANDNTSNAFGPAVGMEGVLYRYVTTVLCYPMVNDLTLLFNILSLSRLCPFGDSLTEQGHKLSDTVSCSLDVVGGKGGSIFQYLERVNLE